MKTKYIHVNQHNIRKNKKENSNLPVLTCKTYDSNDYGHEIIIYDKDNIEVARVIYSPDNPLSCGAHCYIKTKNKVEVI